MEEEGVVGVVWIEDEEDRSKIDVCSADWCEKNAAGTYNEPRLAERVYTELRDAHNQSWGCTTGGQVLIVHRARPAQNSRPVSVV